MFNFLLAALHAQLASFDVKQDECGDCERSAFGYKIELTRRNTCRLCLQRDFAILNCEAKLLLSTATKKPTSWICSFFEMVYNSEQLYLTQTASSAFREAGFDTTFMFPVKGSVSYTALERELSSLSTKKWNDIDLNEHKVDGVLNVDGVISRHLSSQDLFIGVSDLVPIMRTKEFRELVGQDDSPYLEIEEHIGGQVKFGKYTGCSSDTARAVTKVCQSTLIPEALKDGQGYDELRLAESLFSSQEHVLNEAIHVKGYVIRAEHCIPCPHYQELWFTRKLCCNGMNKFKVEVERLPCALHLSQSTTDDGIPERHMDTISVNYGVNKTSSGSLRLEGSPPLRPDYLTKVKQAISAGKANPLFLYLTRAGNAVQRKLGGVSDSVMKTLSAVWGGVLLIPDSALNACKGLPEKEALAKALDKGVVAKSAPKPKQQAQPKTSQPKVAKGVHEYKHTDDKLLQKVRSAFGTKSFQGILSCIRRDLGAGKYPIDKVYIHFHGGKLKTKDRAAALKLRSN